MLGADLEPTLEEVTLGRTPENWRITASGPAFSGNKSRFQPVRTPKFSALLKRHEGDSEEVRRSSAMLRRYRGVGSIQLLRKHQNLLLLEQIDGPSLCSLIDGHQDTLAIDILTDVVDRLHKPRRAKLQAPLVSLQEHMQPLLAQRFSDNTLYRHAARLMQYLIIDDATDDIPLHGNLDYDHVLHHSQRGWLAINPKGLFGDRHYEFAAALCHQCQRSDFSLLRSRTLARAGRIAANGAYSPDRLLTFAFGHACLQAVMAERLDGDVLFWRDLGATLLDCLASDQQVFQHSL